MKNILNIATLFLCLFLSTSLLAKTFKIATAAPDGSFWMKQMRSGAKEIKKLTNGRVKLKYYPGGVMGSEDVVLKKIRIRQLQGAAVSNGGVAKFYPDSQIYTLPMLFRNYAEVDFIRSIFDKRIIEGIEKGGMVSFSLAGGGFAYPMSSSSSIYKTEDLNDHKIWSPNNNKQAELTLDAFGVTPIPLNIGDVLAGLQTNLIDTIAVSPVAAIALQWHTQIKHITKIPLTYIYAVLIIDKKAFSKISKDDQKIVKEVMNKVFVRIGEQNRKDNVLAFEAMINQGVKVTSLDEDTIKGWNDKGLVAIEFIRSKNIMTDKGITEVTDLLKEYRLKKENLGASR